MLYQYEQLAQQACREAQLRAARERVVNRQYAAQRWQRLAVWSAHRSAMAERASRECYPQVVTSR